MKTAIVTPLDASKSKPLQGGPSFSLRHRLVRAAWSTIWLLLASWTPSFMWPWRRLLLQLFGAKMGKYADVRGTARIWYPPNLHMDDHTIIAGGVDCYNMGLVSIGKFSIISQRAVICGGTHDLSDPNRQLVTKPIIIESNCWVAAEAFIGPGVTLKRGAVLGARAVAFKDLETWTVYIGNPAKPLRGRAMEET